MSQRSAAGPRETAHEAFPCPTAGSCEVLCPLGAQFRVCGRGRHPLEQVDDRNAPIPLHDRVVASAPGSASLTRSKALTCIRGGRPGGLRSRWLLVAAACLAASLLPVPAAAAAEGPIEAQQEPSPEDSADGVEIVRYASSDPYAMSIEVAQALVDANGRSSEWVVLASGESWADAAAAGPLAASRRAPVLLVPPGGLQTSAARPDLIEFLESSGVRRVVIVGSPDVLPNHEPSVLFGLGMLPRNIERVHGDDPVGTSIAVAERIGTPAEFGEPGRTVIIASDSSVADAVAIGPFAAAGPFPLLLTAPDALDQRIAEYLTEHEVSHVLLVGGTAAIAPAVQQTIETSGITVTRLDGRDRADTARLAAELFEQHTDGDPACTDGPTRIGFAATEQPEQALTAGSLLARKCSALRYAEPDRLPLSLRNTLYLARQQPHGAELIIFGSESAIADAALDVSLPPVRLAFVSVGEVADDRKLSTQIAVANEHGAIRLYSQTEVKIPVWPYSSSQRVCRLRDLAWSPSGRFLSYRSLCTSEIFVLDIETGEAHQVVSDDSELVFEDLSVEDNRSWGNYRMGPLWSPDGSAFVFTAFLDDPSTVGTWRGNPLHFAELFVHDAISRTTRRLTENTVHDLVSAWSPDSRAVRILQHGEPGASDPYYRVPLDSATIAVSDAAGSRRTRCGFDAEAARSPDGAHVAYYFGGWWTREIGLCSADGVGHRQLTPVDCSECAEGHQHHGADILGWNRSGSMLAFSDTDFARRDGEFEARDYDSETTADYVLDVESGEIRTLFEFTHKAYEPPPLSYLGWSPNDDGLLYLRRDEDRSVPRDLVLLDDVTGEITDLRDIPLLRLPLDRPVQPRLPLSPDQSQLLLIYDGWWHRGIVPRQDGGMWLASIQPGDATPLIDFGPMISMAKGDTTGNWRTARTEWRCVTKWSASGILGICG